MRLIRGSGRIVVVCLVFLVVAVLVVHNCFAVDSSDASSAIDQAQNDLSSAYDSVSAASAAGADVSALLSKLDNAAVFLTQARSEYLSGDYERAVAHAVQCSQTLEGVSGDADGLTADSEAAAGDRFVFSLAVSGVGLFMVLGFGFFGWRYLKERYYGEVLKKKPQVEGA